MMFSRAVTQCSAGMPLRRCGLTTAKVWNGRVCGAFRTDASISQTFSTNAVQNENSVPSSNRARFRSIPVNPSILQQIAKLGVGIPDRRHRRPARRGQHRPTAEQRRTTKKRGALVDPKKEEEYLRTRGRRPANLNSSKSSDSTDSGQPASWIPPPPFASNAKETTYKGAKVRRKPVRVVASVGSLNEWFPATTSGPPEVALAGRSNVGKSTLLNALLYGNQLDSPSNQRRRRGKIAEGAKMPKGIKAAVSDRPGETKSITFYQLSSEVLFPNNQKAKLSMYLVDLPGYGFAYAAEERSSEWKELMQRYLLERGKTLKRVLFLIDARHGMKKADIDFLTSLESTLYSDSNNKRASLPPIQLVLTKCDLVSQTDLARRVLLVREQLSDCLRREPSALPVMLVSAKPGVGFNNVRGDRACGGVLELQREIAALTKWAKQPSSDAATG